jgi:hypothetical protein
MVDRATGPVNRYAGGMASGASSVQRWRTLVLLYPVLDARYGSGISRKRARRVMAREEREVVMGVVERLPATVLDWSSGLATLEPLDVIEVRRPLTSLSSSGGGKWWVGPREVRLELEEVAGDGAEYDSVYALWPCEPGVPQCGWGCSHGPSDATFGAGFSSISTDHWRTLATDPDPEQGYVHEWLHQVEGVYRGLGLSQEELPSLHDAALFTSTRPTDEPPYGKSYAEYESGSRTWSPWYRDYMTGRLRPADGPTRRLVDAPIGLTPERWGLRG